MYPREKARPGWKPIYGHTGYMEHLKFPKLQDKLSEEQLREQFPVFRKRGTRKPFGRISGVKQKKHDDTSSHQGETQTLKVSPSALKRPDSIADWRSDSSLIGSPGPLAGLEDRRMYLRRPTIDTTVRLHINDALFDAFCAPLILKPPIFDTNAKAVRFYSTHYPLLLQVIPETYVEFSEASYKRSGSPGPHSPDAAGRVGKTKRSTVLVWRTQYLNTRIDELQKESGPEFVTELLGPTFDPTKWVWNKNIYKIK